MAEYFDFEAELLDLPGERRFRRFHLAQSAATFDDLHQAIQGACGWRGDHLFTFAPIAGPPIAACDADRDTDADPASSVKLAPVLSSGIYSMLYNYDFGDDWWLHVRLRGVLDSDETYHRKLIDGAGAFPPEDCGGPLRFLELLSAFERKQTGKKLDEEQRELIQWAGPWLPRFDLTTTAAQFDLGRRPRRPSPQRSRGP